MLLDLREKVRGSKPIKYSLITLISIPFVLVGIGSYFSGGNASPVAEVNGQEINQQQLDRAYQQQRQQMARMFGGQLPAAFDNESLLREQALNRLITQQVLESKVAEQKFAVGDETLGRAIRSLPNFQVDGRFDTEAYQTQLRASGMSVAMFEQSYRDDTAINQFRSGVAATSFTLPSEADRLTALGRQTRTIEAVKFDFAQAVEGVEVNDEEVAAYFAENSENYQFPQRAKIQYIELSGDALAEDIDISEEQAQVYYDENRASYILPEQREASHILLDFEDANEEQQIAAVDEIRARIASGESFEDLARELSDDVGSADLGGSLGVITPGQMVPEFEQAVYGLEQTGELSSPIVTEFGVHLVRLDSITPESGKPFEEVKEEVIQTLQQNEADREFFDLREQLIELTFDNAGSLEPAADATGLNVVMSDWLDSETDSGAVLSHPQVASAMFSAEVLDEENNSEVLEVADRHVIVLRVAEYEGARPKALEDVTEQVTETLRGERATARLSDLVLGATDRLAAGESAESIAEGDSMATAYAQEILDRQSSVFDRGAVSAVFSLPHPGDVVVTDSATLADGSQLALRLDAVAVPAQQDEEQTDSSVPASTLPGVAQAGPNPRLGNTEFEILLESLREDADVEVFSSVSP
ncbi:MAG: SurA N-terminal domain-containing protein [Granulosicoccus sp.]